MTNGRQYHYVFNPTLPPFHSASCHSVPRPHLQPFCFTLLYPSPTVSPPLSLALCHLTDWWKVMPLRQLHSQTGPLTVFNLLETFKEFRFPRADCSMNYSLAPFSSLGPHSCHSRVFQLFHFTALFYIYEWQEEDEKELFFFFLLPPLLFIHSLRCHVFSLSASPLIPIKTCTWSC